MQEFILFYVLPGLVVWLISFRFKGIDERFGFMGTFVLFFFVWPMGVFLFFILGLVALVLCGEPYFDLIRQFLYQDIFKKGG